MTSQTQIEYNGETFEVQTSSPTTIKKIVKITGKSRTTIDADHDWHRDIAAAYLAPIIRANGYRA